MTDQHKYMIDTSVWIDYLRDSGKKLNDLIDRLIDEDLVFKKGTVRWNVGMFIDSEYPPRGQGEILPVELPVKLKDNPRLKYKKKSQMNFFGNLDFDSLHELY